MLTEGVPEDTIAVIDDSGGTLTAPILGDFTAVVCMGGTVRSHLGILTREYNVPCLMNADARRARRRRRDRRRVLQAGRRRLRRRRDGGRAARPDHQGLRRGARDADQAHLPRPAGGQRLHPARRADSFYFSARPAPCRSRSCSRSTPTSRCRTSTPGTAGPELLRKIDAAMPAEEIGDRARQVGTYVNTISMGAGPAVLPRRPPDPDRHGDAEADRRDRRHACTCSTSARRLNIVLPPLARAHHAERRQPRDQIHTARQTQVLRSGRDRRDARRQAAHRVRAASWRRSSAYGFLSHCECRLSFNNHGPYRTEGGNQMLVRDLLDLAECDYPWMDGVAAEIEYNNLTVPVIMKDTDFNIVDDWGSFEATPRLRQRQPRRGRRSTPPTTSPTATSRSTWTRPTSSPTTSTTCARR